MNSIHEMPDIAKYSMDKTTIRAESSPTSYKSQTIAHNQANDHGDDNIPLPQTSRDQEYQ
jgi:hypothetical protein